MATFKLGIPLKSSVALVDMILDELRFGDVMANKDVDTHIDHTRHMFIFTLYPQFDLTDEDIKIYKDHINNATGALLEIIT